MSCQDKHTIGLTRCIILLVNKITGYGTIDKIQMLPKHELIAVL